MDISAVTSSLSALYESCGYSQYKMEKFEEYDLYAKNKDFLASAAVIAFTDTDGRLKALKPDVTLSIVRHSGGAVGRSRLYYAENVYRIGSSGTYSEIPQVGLETIGSIDETAIAEVITLAADSLAILGGSTGAAALDVSHLGIVLRALEAVGVPEGDRYRVLEPAGKKNMHETWELLSSLGVDEDGRSLITSLFSVEGSPDDALPEIARICRALHVDDGEFARVMSAIGKFSPDVRIDLSSVGDTRYYNGFVLRGYLRGAASAVLYGGQYDGLMRRMKKQASGLGFAVYTDLLESLRRSGERCDADCAVVYGDGDGIGDVLAVSRALREGGERVLICRECDADSVRVRRTVRIKNGKAVSTSC